MTEEEYVHSRQLRLDEVRKTLEDQTMQLTMELLNTEVRDDVIEILDGIEDAYKDLSADSNEWTLAPYWFRDEAINLAEMSVDAIAMEIEAHEIRQHKLKVVLSLRIKEERTRSRADFQMLERAEKRLSKEELEDWREKKGAYDRIRLRRDGKVRKSKAPAKSRVRKERSKKEKFEYLRMTLGFGIEDAKKHSGWNGEE